MRPTTMPLAAQTGPDQRSPAVVQLTEAMPLREAAGLMLRHQISGAPVVDSDGRCLGVRSVLDFLRLAVTRAQTVGSLAPPQPRPPEPFEPPPWNG